MPVQLQRAMAAEAEAAREARAKVYKSKLEFLRNDLNLKQSQNFFMALIGFEFRFHR